MSVVGLSSHERLYHQDMMTFQTEIEFQLDEKMFGKNLQSSKRGVAGGSSGMTTEHLRLVLDDAHSTHHILPCGR